MSNPSSPSASATPISDQPSNVTPSLTKSQESNLAVGLGVLAAFILLAAGLIWRWRRRKRRLSKAGVERILNPDTGFYELRELQPRARLRLRMQGVRPVLRREVQAVRGGRGDAPPPAYEEFGRPPGYGGEMGRDDRVGNAGRGAAV